jgi:hypothetical protein
MMSQRVLLVLVLIAVCFGALAFTFRRTSREVPVDVTLDLYTHIAPSLIPGAGDGLFASKVFREGEVVGHLGGRFISRSELTDCEYVAQLADCALSSVRPFSFIDARSNGGHVAKINFAPRTINNQSTHFQNVRITDGCEAPFISFVASRDIANNEELLTSYGVSYNYQFMELAPIRSYFCGLAMIDCAKHFEFEP